MKRIPNAVFLALFVCLTVGFGSIVGISSLNPKPQTHQSPTQNSATKNEPKTDSKTIEERHQVTEEAIAYYTKWLMFFTAILAIATVGLGAATVGQLRLGRAEFISTHWPELIIRQRAGPGNLHGTLSGVSA
jgi:hypothetical protein